MNRSNRVSGIISLAAVLLIGGFGVLYANKVYARPAPPGGEFGSSREPRKVGDYVYFFPWTDFEFGDKLNAFAKENKDKLEITGSGPEIGYRFDSVSGERVLGTIGHWVYVRPKN